MTGFENHGVIVLNDRPVESEQTIVVTGVARSGTSMVARLLDHLGLPMGDVKDGIVFEDFELFQLFSNRDMAGLQDFVAKRNAVHPAWGFKHPHLHTQGFEILRVFRSPRVVITFRDPIAIAERNRIAEQFDSVKDTITLAINDLAAITAFAVALDSPTLLVSYEKAIQNPRAFIETLVAFCGLDAGEDGVQGLLELVEPGREEYRQNARRGFAGYIDGIRGGRLTGWAKQLGDDAPIELALFVGDKPVAFFPADQFRGDLKSQLNGSGMHGFAVDISAFDIPRHAPIAVKVRDRSVELTNSGYSIDEWLKSARAKQLDGLWDKAKTILQQQGVADPEVPNPKLAMPILAAAAKESSDDLQNLWARVLAATMNPTRSGLVRTKLAAAVATLKPSDARLIMYLAQNANRPDVSDGNAVAGALGISTDELERSFGKLAQAGFAAVHDKPASGLPRLDREFLRAVSD